MIKCDIFFQGTSTRTDDIKLSKWGMFLNIIYCCCAMKMNCFKHIPLTHLLTCLKDLLMNCNDIFIFNATFLDTLVTNRILPAVGGIKNFNVFNSHTSYVKDGHCTCT